MQSRDGPVRRHVSHEPVDSLDESQARNGADELTLTARARAMMEAHMAEPDFGAKMLADELGVRDATLARAFRKEGGVRLALTAIRLDAGLLMLVSRPPVPGVIGDVARACGFSNVGTFSNNFAVRFGCMPSEMLAMSAVWPEGKFRDWLDALADRHGFRAALSGVRVERRPMMRTIEAPRRK